ncbi:protein of unknown function [Thermomonospora echinospora]|uniref:DUF397 domain-containing protein n=1 Tax=Thermomonospora echinospora TaxID=1992 RepID=A0A1H6CLX5_9ACTN|nr:DUF397 domain-containing protein [Thermomonospora echinospora]SEG73940.1 protein of unknown function [Thermomonospora echinospora]
MITWRKSSYSGSTSTQSDCVELTRLTGGIGVRDSKTPKARHLSLSLQSFATLVARVKRDELSVSARPLVTALEEYRQRREPAHVLDLADETGRDHRNLLDRLGHA